MHGPTPSRRRRRDRRGRGVRGPALASVPANRTRAQRFDALALGIMEELWDRFPDELKDVQLAVEEVPLLPEAWSADTIPLSSYVPARGGEPARVVVLRRPIERRAATRLDLEDLLLTVIVEQVADVLGLPPEDVHPAYEA